MSLHFQLIILFYRFIYQAYLQWNSHSGIPLYLDKRYYLCNLISRRKFCGIYPPSEIHSCVVVLRTKQESFLEACFLNCCIMMTYIPEISRMSFFLLFIFSPFFKKVLWRCARIMKNTLIRSNTTLFLSCRSKHILFYSHFMDEKNSFSGVNGSHDLRWTWGSKINKSISCRMTYSFCTPFFSPFCPSFERVRWVIMGNNR